MYNYNTHWQMTLSPPWRLPITPFSLNANAIKYHREWKQEITAGVEVELERAPLVWS
jgi:hypothetical protein